MKPVSTHTISRLVWMTFVTSKGRMYSSGSGPEVLGGRQQAEHQLQAEQHHGDGEVPVGDRLGSVAHG